MRSFKVMVAGALAASVLTGCFKSNSEADTDSGIKAQDYVAVGNSLTAGFESGGLRKDWQMVSYPVLLAKAMGIEDFQIPAIDSPGVGRAKIAGLKTEPLYIDSGAVTTKPLANQDITPLLSNRALNRPYNNLGVPGMTTLDFLKAYDSSSSQAGNNGYFNIVLRGGLTNNSPMVDQAIALKPKLMTLWIGNNDILGGIIDGTVIEGKTVTPVAYYTVLMDSAFKLLMTKTEAKIFVANIPSITTIPYVTTIPPVVINPATSTPVLDTAGHMIPLLTVEANVKYVLLPALAYMKKGVGIPTALGGAGTKLDTNYTLTVEEAATAEKLTDGYNAYLKTKCEANAARLTLVDVNALLGKLTKGDLAPLTAKFPLLDPTNSAFSLDGIHPNAKGYKEVAKLFLGVINAKLTTTYKID